MLETFKEFITFLLTKKKYYLIPLAIIIFLFGMILISSQGSVVAPFIYAIF